MDWGDGYTGNRLVGDIAHTSGIPMGDGGGFRTVEHTYTYTGNTTQIYEMQITGRLMAWSFKDPKTSDQELPGPIDNLRRILYRVLDFGDMGWVDLSYAFKDAVNLIGLGVSSGHYLSAVKNMRGMFQSGSSSKSKVNPSTSNWDTSKVTDMSVMFSGATSANPDTGAWDTSSVVDMSKMFLYAESANPNTSGWDTSRVTDMFEMFLQATSANPDTSRWDTSRVTDMKSMFWGAGSANPSSSHCVGTGT